MTKLRCWSLNSGWQDFPSKNAYSPHGMDKSCEMHEHMDGIGPSQLQAWQPTMLRRCQPPKIGVAEHTSRCDDGGGIDDGFFWGTYVGAPSGKCVHVGFICTDFFARDLCGFRLCICSARCQVHAAQRLSGRGILCIQKYNVSSCQMDEAIDLQI